MNYVKMLNVRPAAYVIGIFSSLLLSTAFANICDVNGDGKEGIAETIHSLQIAAGLIPEPPPGTYTNTFGMSFKRISSGTFVMGSPDGSGDAAHPPILPAEPGRDVNDIDETQHLVTLTKSFYMQTTEVTQGQWEEITGYNPSHFSNCGADCPVERVSWFEAHHFANALSLSDSPVKTECYDLVDCTGTLGVNYSCSSITINEDCTGYRLPTEAEWEYSARAGTVTALYSGLYIGEYPCGAEPNLSAISWYCGNAASETHPVGQLQPNGWGLYDMSGNVLEWCEDYVGDYSIDPVEDPLSDSTSVLRVNRGGSYSQVSGVHRSASRNLGLKNTLSEAVGFRLVLQAAE